MNWNDFKKNITSLSKEEIKDIEKESNVIVNKYQVFEIDNDEKKILHHSLDLENANKLSKAYGIKNTEKTYGFEPMHNIDENDVDFSNDIINDMVKENISDNEFLEVFVTRKKEIKNALNNMLLEAKNNKKYSNLDELFKDLEN